MKRRTFGMATAAVAGTSLAAACSSGSDGSGSGGSAGEITVWMYPVIPDSAASEEFWQGVVDDFQAANEDITLHLELQPWDNRDEQIATAIASGTGPDIVLLTADQTLNYQSSGGLQPLTDSLESPDAYLPATVEAVTFDGDLYGVPIYQTSTTVSYNKPLFDDAGITQLPTTWEQLLEAAPALAENGIAILDYSGAPEMTLNLSFYPLLWQAGGSVFTEDGSDIAFDNEQGVQALQFLLDLQEMGGLVPNAAVNTNAIEGSPFGRGEVAMRVATEMAHVELLRTAFSEDAIVVGAPLTGVEQATFGTPGVLAVTTINEDLDAAMRVANFIASPEVAHNLNVAGGNFPVRTDTEPPGDDETTLAFVDALEYAQPGEIFPSSRQVMSALVPHLQSALQGDKTAEQALDDAAAEARGALS